MLIAYRRHNPERCRFTSRLEYRCKCPIWVYGTKDGKIIRRTLKLRDWNRAQELVRRWDVEGAEPKQRPRITIDEWQVNFMQDAEVRNLSPETVRKYHLLFKQLKHFAEQKGIRFVNELDLPLLDEFRASWNDGALSASKKLERMRGAFKFALSRKWITENPAVMLKAPQIKSNPTLPFTADEMERILTAAKDDRPRAFILTMRFSGLRISDVTTLATDSLKGNHLRLYQAKTGEPVSILLPGFVADALRGVPHKNPQYFFWSGTSKIPSAVSVWRKRLAEVFETAKIANGHSHRFRDSFAVSLLEAGVSIEDVSTLLGHQNIKITQKHYSPWVKSRQHALDVSVGKSLAVASDLYKTGTKK